MSSLYPLSGLICDKLFELILSSNKWYLSSFISNSSFNFLIIRFFSLINDYSLIFLLRFSNEIYSFFDFYKISYYIFTFLRSNSKEEYLLCYNWTYSYRSFSFYSFFFSCKSLTFTEPSSVPIVRVNYFTFTLKFSFYFRYSSKIFWKVCYASLFFLSNESYYD